jgi:predicted RNase H-like nuclease (RuvC/YqgF family)
MIMRRTPIVVLAIVSVLLLGATGLVYSKYRQSVATNTALEAKEESTRARYGEAINEIAAIQDSLNAIVLGPDAARLLPSELPSEVQGSETSRDRALARIAVLRAGLERTKERVQELDQNLRKSGVKIAGLQRMITGLKKNIAEKEEAVAQLTTQVDTLQTRVTSLSTEVEGKVQELAAKQVELNDRQHELATVFFTMGTKKELMKSGVVVAQGGVLGVGKTLKPSGQFNETAFTPLDTDQETVIHIPSDKVQILSPQPPSSYTLTPAGDKAMELRILDPKEFRKVKHVVILTS